MMTDDVTEVLKQFKEKITPEMETSKMKGRGADLFARRRERMEKYVITDENRNHKLDQMESLGNICSDSHPVTETIASKAELSQPSTPTTPNFMAQSLFQPKPTPTVSSGYATDMEDDYPSFRQRLRVNYFSECEDDADYGYGKGPRRGRPANRRAWETDVEESSKFTVEAPMKSRPAFEPEGPKRMNPVRKVAPPSRSPSGGSFGQYTSPSTSLSPVRPTASFADNAAPKRTWSRVSFVPRKPSISRTQPQAVVEYPCSRGLPPPVSGPIRATVPTTKKTNFLNSPATKPTVGHRQSTEGSKYRSQIRPVNPMAVKENGIPREILAQNMDESQHGVTPATNTINNASSLSPQTTTNLVSHKSAVTINMSCGKLAQGKQQVQTKCYNSANEDNIVTPETMEEAQPNMCNRVDEHKRAGSSASVNSYVSSNSSMFTSTLPSRCLTPPSRPYTPSGSPRILKIAGTKPALTKSIDHHITKTSIAPAEMHKQIESNPVTPATRNLSVQPLTSTMVEEPATDKKISACLKVLDPSQALSIPKPAYQVMPSPTLNAVLKQESGGGYVGKGPTPAMPFPNHYTSADPHPIACYSRPQQRPPATRPRESSSSRAPQPLGMIAEGMKGKGAKMFEKQQKRMQNYTKETSKDSYPDLANSSGPDSPGPLGGNYSYGFSPAGVKIQPGNDVKIGMSNVVGEFQKNSQLGKARRPSETRRRTRDPLHYQQYLVYHPPSAEDFVGSTPDVSYLHNNVAEDALSCPSSKDFVDAPHSISSSNDLKWSVGDDVPATRSASSISSQKSVGPKTAPKPSKSVVERQLSRESLNGAQISRMIDHDFDQFHDSGHQINSVSLTPSDELFSNHAIDDNVFIGNGKTIEESLPSVDGYESKSQNTVSDTNLRGETCENSRKVMTINICNGDGGSFQNHADWANDCQDNTKIDDKDVSNESQAPKIKFNARKNEENITAWSP